MAAASSLPRSTRSGFMKSSTAAPSLRNSGLETTANGCRASGAMIFLISAAVPTGDVLLLTTILEPFMARATASAVPSTCRMSARPSAPCGVPTAMKTTAAAPTAAARSVEKESRCSSRFRWTSCSRPGS